MARQKQKSKKVRVDKYSKVEPKVHPITIISIVGFFVVIFGLILIFQPTNKEKIYDAYTLYNVDITEDHPFYQVTYSGGLFKKGLKKIIDTEEVVLVYVGFATCPACQTHIEGFESYYHSTGLDEHISTIYYIDPGQNPGDFVNFQEVFPGILNTTPQLLLFIDGEIVEAFSPGTSTEQTDINRNIRSFYETAVETITE